MGFGAKKWGLESPLECSKLLFVATVTTGSQVNFFPGGVMFAENNA